MKHIYYCYYYYYQRSVPRQLLLQFNYLVFLCQIKRGIIAKLRNIFAKKKDRYIYVSIHWIQNAKRSEASNTTCINYICYLQELANYTLTELSNYQLQLTSFFACSNLFHTRIPRLIPIVTRAY